ncbi:MAG TPA: hypothetical protein VEN29_09050 [Casimicrobiaceae bacterium]|nr:hypothetical protein [Casimicrobiaceae bacterium]
MKHWMIAITSPILGFVSALFVATLLQHHVARPIFTALGFWVQFVWMIPFFLFLAERRRGNPSSQVPGTVLRGLLAATVGAGAVAIYKIFVFPD